MVVEVEGKEEGRLVGWWAEERAYRVGDKRPCGFDMSICIYLDEIMAVGALAPLLLPMENSTCTNRRTISSLNDRKWLAIILSVSPWYRSI